MKRSLLAAVVLLGTGFGLLQARNPIPEPAVDIPAASVQGKQTVVLGGGCFWGVQGVFERVKGVTDVVAGFAGGNKSTAHYERVSEGDTGHAESVKITYDPAQISFGQLLMVFFSVVHDPTEVNRQGPDTGSQYRSVIFAMNDDQKRVAEAYVAQLNNARVYGRSIATQIVPYNGFWAAESYHQHYLDHNPSAPYIVYNDLPKIAALKKEFPQLCARR